MQTLKITEVYAPVLTLGFPQGGRKEVTPKSCPLAYMYSVHVWIRLKIETNQIAPSHFLGQKTEKAWLLFYRMCVSVFSSFYYFIAASIQTLLLGTFSLVNMHLFSKVCKY